MQLISTLPFLLACSSVMAIPSLTETNLVSRDEAPKIGVGVQYQGTDGNKNHYVVWNEGKNGACSNHVVLRRQGEKLCGDEFHIDGFHGKFGDCNSDNWPESMYGTGGTRIRACTPNGDKIHCAHTHDIIKGAIC